MANKRRGSKTSTKVVGFGDTANGDTSVSAKDKKNCELRWQSHFSAARKCVAANNLHAAVMELQASVKFATSLSDYRLANSFAELGFVALRLEEFESARSFISMAISVREGLFGQLEPSVAIEYNNLAMTYEWNKDYARAKPILIKAVQILETIGTFETVAQAEPYEGLASVFVAFGEYQEAEAVCKKALQIRDKHLGRLHPLSLNTLQFLIQIHRAAGDQTGVASIREAYAERLREFAGSSETGASVEAMRRLLQSRESSGQKERYDSCIGDFLKLMARR